MESQKIYLGNAGGGSDISTILATALQSKGLDPNVVMSQLGNRNGFFGGNGFESIIALIIVAAIFGNGNFGFGGWGGNGGNIVASTAEREMLMSAIQRNGTDLSQLAQTINCSNDRLRDAIGAVSTQLCNFAGQNGLSFQQVINAIQSGNAALTHQLADCCCATQKAILESNYLTERGFCNTNQILSKGFSDLGYADAQQTCELKGAIADSTAKILEGQRAAEMREMQDKLDALREKNSQQALFINNSQQTAQFAAMLAPLQADLAELKCNQVPVKKIACPEQYIPLNTGINATFGLVPTGCGYGYGYGGVYGGYPYPGFL